MRQVHILSTGSYVPERVVTDAVAMGAEPFLVVGAMAGG